LYSSGDRHGSDLLLREVLEPLFVRYNVSVVLNGHDHFYERVKPQKGIGYFVVGSGGQLRKGNIDRASGITAKAFDTDQAFMAAEIIGDEMSFNVISRIGQIVDRASLRAARSRPDSRTCWPPPAPHASDLRLAEHDSARASDVCTREQTALMAGLYYR
jgi:hypothetical protein